MLDILSTIDSWLREQRRIALATVVETWGSAPRRAGAKMGIDTDMAMIGSVSGGCVETAVVEEALGSLKKGRPRLLNYGVSDDAAWEVGLACGGKIAVFVEALDRQWWDLAAERVRQDRPLVTATILDGDMAGQKLLAEPSGLLYESGGLDRETGRTVLQAALDALKKGATERVRIGDLDVLLDVYRPRPRLVIVGGAHVAMALKNFAHELGFRVFLIDPRTAFATPERFPDVEYISHSYPDKALAEIGLTPETYITILTHDPKIDDPALKAALPSPAPYVGILSSMRTHKKRIERLTEAGLDPALFARMRVPIGLDIGAQTPEEIALCIMAQIIAVRNGVAA